MSKTRSTSSRGARPIITLTTDFGAESPYVAAIKGAILSINPQASIVDVSHSVPPQDIRQGAWVLDEVLPTFPRGTIHVAVVDPGVGTSREIVCATFDEQHCIAPDNGLLSRLALRSRPTRIVAVSDARWWRSPVSNTFHGRDIMAPVAAHLSLGVKPAELGPPRDSLVELDWAEVRVLPGKIQGSVRSVDTFGNLITDITRDALAAAPRDERLRIDCDEHHTFGLFETYGDQPEMTLMALVGSSGYLELAIVGDSAALMLGIGIGAPVTLSW
jgi:S-adenosylmethionine hydrolase